MKGQYFVEIVDGRMTGQGRVVNQINNDHFQVMFKGPAPYTRVMPVGNMLAMVLFPTQKDMETWIKANAAAPAPAESDELTEVERMADAEAAASRAALRNQRRPVTEDADPNILDPKPLLDLGEPELCDNTPGDS